MTLRMLGNLAKQLPLARAMLLRWANALNASSPRFAQAHALLQAEDSVIGRVVRLSKASHVNE